MLQGFLAPPEEKGHNILVTVYSTPACVQCKATYRALEAKGVEYTAIDVTQDAQAMDRLKSLGYVQAPVVFNGDEHWSGFQPDRIRDMIVG